MSALYKKKNQKSPLVDDKKQLLFCLLKSKSSFDDEKIQEIVRSNPDLCAETFRWKHLQQVNYRKKLAEAHSYKPLLRIFHFNPSINLVHLVYESHPPAISETNHLGRLPLHVACRKGTRPQIVCWLLAEYPQAIKEQDSEGILPLHLALQSRSYTSEMIRYLISEYREAVKVKDCNGWLPLHYACQAGASPKVIGYLISEYREGVMAKNRDGSLPLHVACAQGATSEAIVSLLVQSMAGACGECLGEKDCDGRIPLHLALENKQSPGVVSCLLAMHKKGAKERDNNGNLPLHVACSQGASPEVIHSLVREYQEGARCKNFEWELPLHLALQNGVPPEVIRGLVSIHPGGVGVVTPREGDLPLHIACTRGASTEVVRCMVFYYPKGLKEMNNAGDLPLHVACSSGAPLGAILCLASGYVEGVQKRDHEGNLPLHLACRTGAPLSVIQYLVCVYPESVKMLDSRGWLPVHCACHTRASPQAIRYLASEHPSGILHSALRHRASMDLFRCLLPEIEDKDVWGNLPFHFACSQPYTCHRDLPEIIHLMQSDNRDIVKEKDGSGKLPLHVACQNDTPHDIILSLVSEHPEGLDALADLLMPAGWRARREEVFGLGLDAFLCQRRGCPDDKLFVIRCSDDRDAKLEATITANVFRKARSIKGVAVVGGGLCAHTMTPIAEALKSENRLLTLGLGNNPIGDAGAKLLAGALSTQHGRLELLDLHDCSIGPIGLSALLSSLKVNKTLEELDLSYNSDIFNACGGQVIASHLPVIVHVNKLRLYREKGGDVSEVSERSAFLESIFDKLCWCGSARWPLLLNQSSSSFWQIIEYYRGAFHQQMVSCDPQIRLLYWHLLLGRMGVASNNNMDVLFRYLKNYPEDLMAARSARHGNTQP